MQVLEIARLELEDSTRRPGRASANALEEDVADTTSQVVSRRFACEGEISTWHERDAVEEAIPDWPWIQ